ncbi:ABC transporter substrate-binding protein [Oxalicibacterium faecigallinarum]|uniref:Leucine-binding protein domain-containing protein n=1 Tax=Oxalicibacterium faecigallinarum TaxID=573741 RepID=A0A8J3F230_9BURK|nr:ABC transporter substrate-binding protein [Oxalicibacterium faecigallinarum]GGI17962.1 hypothetical protein GCM10008066_11610 [Oxalicibacterium faecigallinarum]
MLMTPAPAFADTQDTIVIGQVIDLSSPNASLGRDYVAGIKTYFDMVNATGGINGKKIHYIARDDQSSAIVAARLTTELIENDRIDYLLGGIGESVTRAVLDTPTFKRSRLQLYAPLVSASSLKPGGKLVLWRPDYLHEVQHMLSHFGGLGITRVGIALQDEANNRQTLALVTSELKQRGLQLIGTARITVNEQQTEAEARKLAATSPGVVIVIGDTINTGMFLKAFRKSAPKIYVAGTSLINLETLRELAGSRAVEWTVFSQVVPNPNTGKSVLQREHQTMMVKYRDEPPSTLTLEGFAVAKTLAMTIRRGKQTGTVQDLGSNGSADLGGMAVRGSTNQSLSSFVDIALFSKNGLLF